MSSIYGISGTSGSNIFSSMLGNSTDSSTSTSSSLTDYALIRSGAYKKLVKAYYKNEESSKSEAQTKAEKTSLTATKDDAKALANTGNALVGMTFTEENREKIIENIKNFASSYNEIVKDTDDVNNTAVLRNTLWLTQQTSAFSESLSKIGITIKEGNELKVDEEKLKTADLSTMKSLFSGYSSYGSYVTGKASQIYSASSAAINATGSGSAYNAKGKHVAELTGNIMDTDV